MRNLVTGGAGFIGSHLCKFLLDVGEHVICLDNLASGQIDNIRQLETSRNFEFIEGDITEKIDFVVDRIYNLACPASPLFYQADPIKTMKTSILGALNVLELAKATEARVLQTSTSEVYGDPKEHPQKESYWGHVNPIGVRACYDEGKRAAETLFFDYKRQFNIEIKIARIFNTYGPNMRPDDGRVISNLIVQALSAQPLTVYGSGKQSRSFCYVDDIVAGLVAMMNSPKELTGPINLGNPEEFTILELVDILSSQIPNSSPVKFYPLPQDDPKQRKPDITIAKKFLNWQPTTRLVDGISPTISYFQTRLRN